MKRFLALTTLCVLATILVSGCSGISKASYDDLKAQLSKAQADLNTAQSELTKSKSDLTAAQQSLSAVTADRDSTNSQLDKVKADLTIAQQSLSTLHTSVKAYEIYVDLTTWWYDAEQNWSSWDENTRTVWKTKEGAAVSATQDASLKALWERVIGISGEHAGSEDAFLALILQRLTETRPKSN